MYTKAFEKLVLAASRGAAVLTVNARLTRHLASEYDLAMRRSGATAWPTPVVMPFLTWVASLWEEHAETPALSGLRARVLWERVVSADPLSEGLPSGVARDSYEGYRLSIEYGLKLPEDIYLTEEAKALKRWSALYEAELRRLGFVSEARLPMEARRLIERGAPVPGEVVLAGFDELSPAVSSIAAALQSRGTRVVLWPAPDELPAPGETAVVRCGDEDDEVEAAARWVRAVYRPGRRIGVIVPGLEGYRRRIVREFTAELSPAAVLPGSSSPAAFNISLGSPLSEDPLVASALAIISMGGGKAASSELAAALGTPFFAGEDKEAFDRLDLRLRQENRLEASLFEAAGMLSGGAARRLGEWIAWLKGAARKQPASAWAKDFTSLLGRTGWLKGMKLASGEFQALSAWNKALESFASLDDVLGRISRGEAALRLKSIAKETVHQVETPETGVQVLGLLEATGLWFDHVRVLGCHEYALPAEPSPSPFIPLPVQAFARLPHSTSERELEFAAAVTRRLLSSAPSIVVSWPRVSEDRELRVSPFFSGSAVVIEEPLPSSRLIDMKAELLEDAPPDAPLPVGESELPEIRGGTSILKNQSICPFRAFVVHRLGAVPLPAAELDLKPEARGDILHEAMRLFWEDVRDSRRLAAMKEAGELSGYVESIAAKALEGAKVPPPLSSRFVELERKRLSALLMDWAALELKRGVGFRVKTMELEKELQVGGLLIKGRVDRVDELDGGGELIIDYKTGKNVATKDWLTKRPMEPQLLVYSLGSKPDALSFARVVPGKCRFLGITKEESTLPGIKRYEEDKFKADADGLDWEGLMGFWKEALEGLAADFLAGVADVDPNNGPRDDRACRHCELKILCRISDGVQADEEDDDEDP